MICVALSHILRPCFSIPQITRKRVAQCLTTMASVHQQIVDEETESKPSVGNLTNLGLSNCLATDHESAGSFHRILIVGDGDFSYSRALAQSLQLPKAGIEIVATSYDSKEDLSNRYPRSEEMLNDLIAKHQIKVYHSVDATNLKETLPVPRQQLYTRIVFNYPHYPPTRGNRNKIQKHRELLQKFFISAEAFLDQGAQIWVTLAPGQGGTGAERETREWQNHWQVVANAAISGLILIDVHGPPTERLAGLGYFCTGFRLQQKGFRVDGGLTHVFCRDSEANGMPCLFPVVWKRDVSFSVHEADFTEESFLANVRQCCGPDIDVTAEHFDSYVHSETNVSSRGYHLAFVSTSRALSNVDANKLTEDIYEAQMEEYRRTGGEV